MSVGKFVCECGQVFNAFASPVRVKVKVQEYEYDADLEPSYRNSLFKSYNKTLDEGFFPMVIVDAVHEKVCGCGWACVCVCVCVCVCGGGEGCLVCMTSNLVFDYNII